MSTGMGHGMCISTAHSHGMLHQQHKPRVCRTKIRQTSPGPATLVPLEQPCDILSLWISLSGRVTDQPLQRLYSQSTCNKAPDCHDLPPTNLKPATATTLLRIQCTRSYHRNRRGWTTEDRVRQGKTMEHRKRDIRRCLDTRETLAILNYMSYLQNYFFLANQPVCLTTLSSILPCREQDLQQRKPTIGCHCTTGRQQYVPCSSTPPKA